MDPRNSRVARHLTILGISLSPPRDYEERSFGPGALFGLRDFSGMHRERYCRKKSVGFRSVF